MKKLLTLVLFFTLLVSCKKDVPAAQNTQPEATPKDSVSPAFTVKVEESSEEEFEGGTPAALLDGFIRDNPGGDTLQKLFITINTQKQKLTFKNINPAMQKGYYDEDELIYTDLGYSKKINMHLLHAQYYEGDDYFLIDNATTKTDTINGWPDFSLDARKMICYYINPYNERKYLLSADIEIYDLTENGLVTLHRETYDYIPCEIRWKDNNTILLKVLPGDEFDKMQSDTVNKTNYNYLYKKIHLK